MSGRFVSPRLRDSEVVLLRGDDRGSLLCAVQRLKQQLDAAPDLALADVAYTVNSQLLSGGQCLGLVAKTCDELQKHLDKVVEKLSAVDCEKIHDIAGIYYNQRPCGAEGQVAFLFPGEGAQYLGMVGDLLDCFPAVNQVVDELRHITRDQDRLFGLDQLILTVPADEELRNAMRQELKKISTTMLTVLSANWALWEVMKVLGIQADAMAGHSAGELAAVWAAGGVQANDHSNLVAPFTAMDSEVSERADAAALLAVGAGRDVVAEFLKNANLPTLPDGSAAAYLAMDNCPHQTVVVGMPDAVAELESQLHENRIICERLAVDRPYHTPLFEPYMQRFRKMFSLMSFVTPHTTVYSCTTAEPFPAAAERIADLVVEHWASRVEFTKMIQRMYQDGIRVFVEVGPKGNLSAFVQDILRGKPCLVVPANVPRHAAATQINHLVALLAANQVQLSVAGLYGNRPVELVKSMLRTSGAEPINEAIPTELKRDGLRQQSPTPITSRKTSFCEPENQPSREATATTLAQDEKSTTVRLQHTSRRGRRGQHVLVAHQQLMQQFLDAQHRVMRQYLEIRQGHVAVEQGLRETTAMNSLGALATSAPSRDGHGSGRVGGQVSRPMPARPLVGEVQKHEPGMELITRRHLELTEDLYAGEHTVGGREISRVNPQQYGLPVAPMTFTLETMAQNALHLFPGYVVKSIRNVRLQRWLAFYEDDPCTVEVNCRCPEKSPETSSDEEILVRVEILDLGNRDPRPVFKGGRAATGEVILGPRYPTAPPPAEIQEEVGPCHVTIEQVYANLFHGPLFQELIRLDSLGATTISGQIKVGSRDHVFASRSDPDFVLDPVMLDVATHCLAGWHLAMPDQSGRIMLPFELKSIDFYGSCPAEGDEFTVQGRLTSESSRHFEHAVDIVRPDGTLHARFLSAKFWRFYLPFHDVNFHGRKDVYYLSQEWPAALADSTQEIGKKSKGGTRPTSCIRITPPDDLLQPAMLMVAGRVILSLDEQDEFDRLDLSDVEKGKWLFVRAALKDAVRRYWQDHYAQASFVADIELQVTPEGAWCASRRSATNGPDVPCVAAAQIPGVTAAVAARSQAVGIGLATIEDDMAGAENKLDPQCAEIASCLAVDPREGRIRMQVAQQALEQASRHGKFDWDVTGVSHSDGKVQIAVREQASEHERIVCVHTHREDDLIVATVVW